MTHGHITVVEVAQREAHARDIAPVTDATAAGAAVQGGFPRYISAQLHCHSSIEGPASIGAHCFEAARAGVEVVWLTDHDTRISLCIGGPFIDRFDFESPELTTTVERVASGGKFVQRTVGWHILRRDEHLTDARASLSRERCYTGTQSLCVEAASDEADEEWRSFVIEFKADSKIHSRPLLASPTVGAAVSLDAAESVPHAAAGEATAEAWLDLVLSEQPPDLRQARLRYLLVSDAEGAGGSPDDEDRYHTHVIPLAAAPNAPASWTRHEIRPGDDAEAGWRGGVDNALVGLRLGLRLRRGGRLRLFLDDLTIAHRCAGNELHALQRSLARTLGERYGVTCHVAQEISQAGQHKNAWGSGVPLLDYATQPSGFTHEHGVDWAQRHGGVFSLNHPFSGYNRRELDEAAREKALAGMIETYVGTRASGANTLEVGFPSGRHGFDLDHYLRLWDGLSLAGVIITGSGSSDAHSARVGWQTGNNFATYILAGSTDEDALVAGLRSGNVYMADPIHFRSRLRFGDRAGHRMGQVVGHGSASGPAERVEQAEVEIALDRARPTWRLYWVVNGARRPGLALAEGTVAHTLLVPLGEPAFVRAEVYDTSRTPAGPEVAEPDVEDATAGMGRCVALTNPIWYVPEDGLTAVPLERRA